MTSPRALATFLVLYALALGLIVGLGSAWWMVRGTYPLGREEAPSWVTWPYVGSKDVDPYARAILARTSDIPLGLGEGVPLTASVDGRTRLDPDCAYRVSGITPAARYWTFTLHDGAGRPVETPLGRASFTSSEVLRAENGTFEIVLSRTPRPGNWIQMPAQGGVTAVLRLYDTPVSSTLTFVDQSQLPTVSEEECGS